MAGGIDGGIWKTTNFNTNPATWTPVNDFFSNLAVSSICQDPSDANIMYFGTGEKAFNADAVSGGGVWKSTNHGATFTLLSNTTTFYNVSKILCDAAGNVYCATIGSGAGLQRSNDKGGTWTNISVSGMSSRYPDFEISSTGRMHVCTGYYNSSPAIAVYRYTDNPSTVTSTTWTAAAVPFANSPYNTELACNGNVVYALVSNSSFVVPTIYRSSDGGANWATTSAVLPTSGNTAFSNGQAWYCLAADVDPTNAANIVVGSLNCYKSADSGKTFSKVSDWVGTAVQYVHADQHIVKYLSSTNVLVGCDGGIHLSTNGGSTWSDRNTNLRIKQFYSVAMHPTLPNYFLAGAQDNGCHQFTNPGLGSTVEVTGGDGAFVHIDQGNPLVQIGSYVFAQYRVSIDGGANWTSRNFSGSAGQFINPTDYDNTNQKLYGAWSGGFYHRWDDPATAGNTNTLVDISTVINLNLITAVTVSPHIGNTVYFGTDNSSGIGSKIVKCQSANTSAPTVTDITGTLPSTLTPSCIAVGPNASDLQLMVTYSNYSVLGHVFYSSTGGAPWTNITGNLPDMPVRWALFNPNNSTMAIIATEAGVYTTSQINGSSTVWTASPTFPIVRTDMLKYRASDQTVAAATHGRGLWTQSLLTILPVKDITLQGNLQSDGKALLTWNSSSATISTHFHLQYSNDGISFSEIANVASNVLTYKHNLTASVGYYRILATEPSQAPVYSNTVVIRSGKPLQGLQVRITPNPVSSVANFVVSSSEAGNYSWTVTDMSGKIIQKGNGNLPAGGSESKTLNAASLPKGTYQLHVLQAKQTINTSFVKQ